MKTDVVVIGGGPAGLFSAAIAAKNGNKVILIDKNEVLARKLRITGKGRCNVTNSADISDFIGMVCSNPNFMYSAFYSFTNEDLINFFENAGVPLKEERGGRIFPVSDSAKDVANALIKYAKDNGVVFIKDAVTKVMQENNIICGVLTKTAKKIDCSRVIVATGGASYTLTGSTGDGYKFAKELGHTVVTPYPSLIPLVIQEDYVKDLQGLSLKNVAVKVTKGTKCIYEDFGEMIFTHYGLSGPVILSASSNLKNIENSGYKISIDLKPALTFEQLDKRIQRDFEKNINKNFSNSLDELLPSKMIDTIIKLSGIDPYIKVHQINKQQRTELCNLLKNFTLTVTGVRPIEEAIITRGGISTKEINPSTMESKIIEGLFFCGEVIDVDAYTGGFNLQIAFSTAYLAGSNV